MLHMRTEVNFWIALVLYLKTSLCSHLELAGCVYSDKTLVIILYSVHQWQLSGSKPETLNINAIC
jgi:hypothetical protein